MTVALYIRLSDADDDTGISKAESGSIINQKLFINNYLDNNDDLISYERIEYIDDGYTGTNDLRPSFNRMIKDVQDGLIKVICVKDFSRFFRDYIEAGNYLECVFPFLGVRFISINDKYDSNDYKGTTGGLEMVMRNIIYTAYSKDLSQKVISGKRELIKQGKFIGSHAPYGYKKSSEDKNKLIIDEKSSIFVKLIFDLALDGKSVSEISLYLNQNNIPTRSQYFKELYPNCKRYDKSNKNIQWMNARVYDILKNPLYKGDMVSMRKRKVSFNSKKIERLNPIIIKGTHQGIVTEVEFQKVQDMIKKQKQSVKKIINKYLLRGYLRCGYCEYLMDRNKSKNIYYFSCKQRNTTVSCDCKKNINIDESKVESIITNVVHDYVKLFKDKQNTFNEEFDTKKVSNLNKKIKQYKQDKIQLYEKYVNNYIEKEIYINEKNILELKYKETEEELITITCNTNNICDESIVEVMDQTTLSDDKIILSEKLLTALVKSVYIFNNNVVEIEFKFNDIFKL